MLKRIPDNEIYDLVARVFATDEDLYLKRQHCDDKTLDGLVSWVIKALFDGGELSDVEFYSYGDEFGFFAVNIDPPLLRSFGIKKEHRDKKELFWDSLCTVLGDEFIGIIWKENRNAIRFFEQKGGMVYSEKDGGIAYNFNLN